MIVYLICVCLKYQYPLIHQYIYLTSEFSTKYQFLSEVCHVVSCRSGWWRQIRTPGVASGPGIVANVLLSVSPDAATGWVGVGGSLYARQHKIMSKIPISFNLSTYLPYVRIFHKNASLKQCFSE